MENKQDKIIKKQDKIIRKIILEFPERHLCSKNDTVLIKIYNAALTAGVIIGTVHNDVEINFVGFLKTVIYDYGGKITIKEIK